MLQSVPTRPLTASQVRQAQAKKASHAATRQWLLGKGTADDSQLSAFSVHDEPSGPRVYVLPEVASMTNGGHPGPLFKEGQGNNKAHNTCGPAATRNMVAAMYKRRDGAYKNIPEATYAHWEHTSSEGTSRANVAAALNDHFSAFGHWTTSRPTDKIDLLATVMDDTYNYHQSVILNIDTEELWFWNNKALNHFDFTYGYDTSSSTQRYLQIGEEWDPIYIYDHSTYGNPYGFRRTPLAEAFTAVTKTSIHGIVS